MKILTFRVNKFAQRPRGIDLAHGMKVLMKTRCLEHHVLEATPFYGFQQTLRIFERTKNRRDRRSGVLAMLEHLDAVPSVIGGVCRDKYRFDSIIFNQFLERWVCLRAPASL